MADILIIGMEMPKTCSQCPLCYDYMKCSLRDGRFSHMGESFDCCEMRLADCPLVELPEHGDLIDSDALKHKFCTHCDGYEYDTGACVDGDQDCMDAKIITTAPVIVPSNKEETE